MFLRILTGIILLILSIIFCFFIPNNIFKYLIDIFFMIAIYEWANFIISNLYIRFIYVISYFLIIKNLIIFFYPIIYLSLIWWLLIGFILIYLPLKKMIFLKNPVVYFLIGLFLFTPAWLSVIKLYLRNPWFIFTVIFYVSLNDSAAYFIGSKWGYTKLSPTISPNKTFEGFFGGIFFSLFLGKIIFSILEVTIYKNIFWILLFLITVLFANIGDLFVSMIKRLFKTKNSGYLLPGHGGLLDRIDSLCAALPFFSFSIFFLTKKF